MSALPIVDAARFGSGQQVQRVEDPALVAGQGQFTDDVAPAGQTAPGVRALAVCACAHRRRSTARARRGMPGVVAVFTGAELAQAGREADAGGGAVQARRRFGRGHRAAPRARARARALRRRAVAMVVADTRDAARAAADAVHGRLRRAARGDRCGGRAAARRAARGATAGRQRRRRWRAMAMPRPTEPRSRAPRCAWRSTS